MLCLVVALGSACGARPGSVSSLAPSGSTPRPALAPLRPPAPAAASGAATEVRAEDVTVAVPEPPAAPTTGEAAPRGPEPLAPAVVHVIATALPPAEPGVERRVALDGLRNQSRAAPAEFEAFVGRLAAVLDRSGRATGLRFTAAAEPATEFTLVGAAYLVVRDGFDQWEVFLRLAPAREPWTIWQAESPLRVLRQPRPGRPQITAVPQ